MEIRPLHRWDLSPSEARRVQRELAGRVVREDRLVPPRTVAGIDLAFPWRSPGEATGRGALVVLELPDLRPIESRVVERPVAFPYVPGLLSFRETPVALAAFELLPMRPDLLIVDGHGVAHPRRFGIACHLGLLLDVPTIGCAKSILVGTAEEPGAEPGAWAPLVHAGETIGAAVRTRVGAKPVYISTGHRVSLETAIALTLACTRGHRLPEPTHQADALSKGR
jgi:deoxyribonuclease V